ncbi:MAG: YmaF family protein [Turicibacter sp.]|nr:YmaF family protein [Turicibacter sp.]
MNNQYNNCRRNCDYDDYNDYNEQTHVHEYSESVKLAEQGNDRHNHRAAGVTGEAIPINGGRNHVHRINDNVDFLDHFHQIRVVTGPAIRIPGTNKHVHAVCGQTTCNDGHRHEFLFTTQIDAPLV